MAEAKELERLLDSLVVGRSSEEIFGPGGLIQALTKRVVERALEAELSEHLGYAKHAVEQKRTTNARNGRTTKRIKTGTAEVSPSLISTVTDAVLEEVTAWQARPLEAFYPILYLDALHLKLRAQQHVQTCAVYVALAINAEGKKEILGLWIGQAEGAKFWLGVLSELKSRGVQDVLIAAVDGLKGFPEAIAAVYPKTEVQQCIVHMVRNSLRHVSWKHHKALARDLRTIYQAPTREAGEAALARVADVWDEVCPLISKQWRANRTQLSTFFDYPSEIRRVSTRPRDRVDPGAAEEGDEEAGRVPDAGLRAQGALSCLAASVRALDDADPELACRAVPLLDRIP